MKALPQRKLLLFVPMILAAFLMMSGCSTFNAESYSSLADESDSEASTALLSERRLSTGTIRSDIQTMASLQDAIDDTAQDLSREQDARLRILQGHHRLQVNDPEGVKTQIRTFAEEIGGYVDQSYELSITIRVPAEEFQRAMDEIADMGRVLDQQVSSYDVSDSYRDTEQRLRLAQDTRQRLYVLLEQSTDVEEQVEILREIRRLTEQIEQMNNALEQLDRAISYSRIEVELVSAIDSETDIRSRIPFAWIRNLHPGVQTLSSAGRINLPQLTERFAVLEHGGHKGFYAESATGVRVMYGNTKNQPAGDMAFWQHALGYHLSNIYASTQEIELNDQLTGYLFVSMDPEPYYYEIFIDVRGSNIGVYEIFYPDETEYLEYASEIHDSLLKSQGNASGHDGGIE